MSAVQLNDMTDAQLDVEERKIAGQYMRGVPWDVVVMGFANTAVWLSLWPLVLLDIMPLWLGFIVAVICVSPLAYLPSHDAQHNIIARKGTKLRWLNELLGHVSVIPLAMSFRVLRHTHLEHHKHANDPALDPDYDVHVPNRWAFFKKHVGSPAGSRYGETLMRIGRQDLVLEGVIVNLVYLGVLFGMAWTGHAIEAALLWWLPRHIGMPYLRYYLSWLPHHPARETGRYRDTRAFKSPLGNIGSAGMQFHIVHHLYPTIPLTRTPAAYWALRPILERKGCDLGGL